MALIAVGVTGGIGACKAVEIVRRLQIAASFSEPDSGVAPWR